MRLWHFSIGAILELLSVYAGSAERMLGMHSAHPLTLLNNLSEPPDLMK